MRPIPPGMQAFKLAIRTQRCSERDHRIVIEQADHDEDEQDAPEQSSCFAELPHRHIEKNSVCDCQEEVNVEVHGTRPAFLTQSMIPLSSPNPSTIYLSVTCFGQLTDT